MVTKKQLVNGIVKFIETDLIPQVGDRNTKFVLAMAKDSLKEDNNLAEKFLHSPMISSVITEENGSYDIGHFSCVLHKILTEYQSFPITIPKIPLFSPEEKTVKITADDLEKVMKYITETE